MKTSHFVFVLLVSYFFPHGVNDQITQREGPEEVNYGFGSRLMDTRESGSDQPLELLFGK